LVQDARRHGVETRTPCVNASDWCATLEPCERSEGGLAVRLGLSYVRHVGDDLAKAIAAGRPYASIEDVARRSGASGPALEALATAGAFACFDVIVPSTPSTHTTPSTPTPRTLEPPRHMRPGGSKGQAGVGSAMAGSAMDGGARSSRRAALWTAGAATQAGADRLEGIVVGTHAPTLPGMEPVEEAMADLWATGVAPDGHPTRFLRDHLDGLGVVTSRDLAALAPGSKVLVGGVVTHRQRPATAGGTMFINLEDETGLINVVCSLGCWIHHRTVARSASAMLIRGRLERSEGVTNVVAERIEPLPVPASIRSRDFR
jgi:error-prone DNA polymerase